MSAQQEYLEENAKKEGVEVTASGLQIKHEVEGSGKQPSASDTVEVHYAGKLIDGSQFDSSYDRGQTISFPLNGVIAGWTEGLQLMKEGGKAELTIPANLGYGERGAGGVIPGGATLIFTVELIAINSLGFVFKGKPLENPRSLWLASPMAISRLARGRRPG